MSWGHNHIDQNHFERHLRSMNRSRNSQPPHPTRRHIQSGIAGSAIANPTINTDHYNLPRCRRLCRRYARNSTQHFQNQTTHSCQVNRNGLTSLLGSSPISPTFLYETGNGFGLQQQPQSPPSNVNFANAAMYSHLIHSNPNNTDSHNHNGSQSYRPIFQSPTNINPSSICMCCFHQLRYAASPQVIHTIMGIYYNQIN